VDTGSSPANASLSALRVFSEKIPSAECDGDGTVRAAGYFVHDERYTTYLLAATDAEVRGAASLVLWEAIKRAADRGTAFDFEGSMLKHVEPFVRSFGGVPTPYSVVRHTPSAAVRMVRGAKRALRRR